MKNTPQSEKRILYVLPYAHAADSCSGDTMRWAMQNSGDDRIPYIPKEDADAREAELLEIIKALKITLELCSPADQPEVIRNQRRHTLTMAENKLKDLNITL